MTLEALHSNYAMSQDVIICRTDDRKIVDDSIDKADESVDFKMKQLESYKGNSSDSGRCKENEEGEIFIDVSDDECHSEKEGKNASDEAFSTVSGNNESENKFTKLLEPGVILVCDSPERNVQSPKVSEEMKQSCDVLSPSEKDDDIAILITNVNSSMEAVDRSKKGMDVKKSLKVEESEPRREDSSRQETNSPIFVEEEENKENRCRDGNAVPCDLSENSSKRSDNSKQPNGSGATSCENSQCNEKYPKLPKNSPDSCSNGGNSEISQTLDTLKESYGTKSDPADSQTSNSPKNSGNEKDENLLEGFGEEKSVCNNDNAEVEKQGSDEVKVDTHEEVEGINLNGNKKKGRCEVEDQVADPLINDENQLPKRKISDIPKELDDRKRRKTESGISQVVDEESTQDSASSEQNDVEMKILSDCDVEKDGRGKRSSTGERQQRRTTRRKSNLEETIEKVATAQMSLPFVESLKGSIKSLSRNDLEELVVQKLCEVITERSTVGELRKKAQILEQDQERWKDKVQSLMKQMREMDMVMKKYMSEVQKQGKERSFQNIAPLRVTRSVGLQVAFPIPDLKLSKLSSSGSNKTGGSSGAQSSEKSTKPAQNAGSTANNAKKNVSTLPSPQSKKQTMPEQLQKKPYSPRPGLNFNLQSLNPQTVVTPIRKQQPAQMNGNRSRLPLPQENDSRIIDLTDDDERQCNGQKNELQFSTTVRNATGQIRLVNQIAPVNQNGRLAYLVPATTSSAVPSGSGTNVASRQVLIATPTIQQGQRQILPSVPPLLYKGSTLLQPGAQQQVLNQPNRSPIPKPLKHPAPLPQAPSNQIQKPNWKLLPPRPALKISKVQTGIVLSWNMTLGPEYEQIASYQLYAYQENNSPPATSLWKKVGDVKALPLPMACTLTQFMSGHKYHFAVRAVDLHSRIGPFSFPGTIVLIK